MSFLFWGSNSSSNSPSDISPVSNPPSDSQQQQTPPPATSLPEQTQPSTPQLRLNSQKLLFGGITCLLLSSLITRRALRQRRIASIPPYYTGSIYHKPRVNGAGDAFEALNIATINVLSLTMVAVGGTMYALNVNGVDDLKRWARRGMYGGDGTLTSSDQEIEAELQEWLGTVLGRKFEKELEKVKEEKKAANEGGKET